MEDLRVTGQEIMDICGGDEDVTDVKIDVDTVQTKYDDVKQMLRGKLSALDEAFRNTSSDVS